MPKRSKPESPLPKHARLLRKWLGERHQADGALLLGFSQQTLSRLLAGNDAGIRVRIKCKQVAGVPLSAWPSSSDIGVTDAELDEAVSARAS